MITNDYATNPTLGSHTPTSTHQNQSERHNQKLVIGLKAEWSEEFIYWSETSERYKMILRLEALKTAQGKTDLTILSRQLDTLIEIEFSIIEKDINELLEFAHQGYELEGFDFMDSYQQVRNEIQCFRKQARNIQLNTLQYINIHLPTYIF